MMMKKPGELQDLAIAAAQAEKEKQYWLDRLSGHLPQSNFPYDYNIDGPGTGTGKPRVKTGEFKLAGEPYTQMTRLSRGADLRLHMILTAVIVILLGKYRSSRDIIVGIPVEKQDSEDRFVNTVLPIRSRLEDDMTFKDLLLQISQAIFQAQENQNYPMEVLLADLGIKSTGTANPLFEVAVILENIHDKSYIQHVHPNMTFTFRRTGQGLEAGLEYNAALYCPATGEQIIRHFNRLLQQVPGNVNLTLEEISVFTGEEKRELLEELNKTALGGEYPPNKTIHEIFANQAAATPGNIGIVYHDQQLTYEEINKISGHLAWILREKGIAPDVIVAIMAFPSIGMIIGLIAILKAGAGYLPIDPEYPEDRIEYILKDSNAKILLTTPGLSAEFKKLSIVNAPLLTGPQATGPQATEPQATGPQAKTEKKQTIKSFAGSRGGFSKEPLAAGGIYASSSIAYIIYTSGTTGKPKGVIIEHRNVIKLLFNDKNLFDFSSGDVWTMFHSYCFDFSVWEMYGALLYGGKLVLVSRMDRRDPARYLQLLTKNRATILNQTPSAFYNLEKEEIKRKDKNLKLRCVIFGGEALKPLKLKEFKEKYPDIKLINMYGITETTVHVTYKEIEPGDIQTGISNIGRALPTLSACIMSGKRSLVPRGGIGELNVGGTGVGRGYLNRPALTKEKFIPNPYIPGQRLYRSGDLVRRTGSGDMEYLGRMDQQVQLRGFRIEPAEIENRLLTHPRISDAAVITGEDENGSGYLCAYVVTAQEPALTTREIRDYLSRELPGFMVPSYIVPLEKIPLTPNGKLDIRALPEPRAETGPDREYTAPRNTMEETVAETWKNVLGLEKPGIKDNYFTLGGDSIKAIQLLSLLNETLETNLGIADLYIHDTIEKLSLHIQQQVGSGMKREIAEAAREVETLKTRIMAANKLPDPGSIEDIYPMSDIEKGMVFHALKEPERAVYHDQMVHQVTYPDFNPRRFEQALRLMMEKHPILRTCFNITDFEEPVHLIYKECHLPLRHEDISRKEKHEQEEYIREYIKADRRHPLNVLEPPLWRMNTFALDTDQILVLFICHHALIDGWSDASFNTELNNIYLALQTEPAYKPGKLKHTYKEFVIEQIAAKKQTQTLDYWKYELEDYQRYRLPGGDKNVSPPGVIRHRTFDLGRPLYAGLIAAAARYNSSIKHLCFAAYIYLLHMLSYETDIVTGLVTNNRPVCEDGEKILGCFLNTVPVRVKIPAGIKWLEFIQRIDKKLVELAKYDRLPLAEIARISGEKMGDRNPVFDTLFSLIEFYVYNRLSQGQDRLSPLDSNRQLAIQGQVSTNTLFNFVIETTPGSLLLEIAYSNWLISDELVEKSCRCYENILEKFIHQPEAIINKNELLGKEEKQKLLKKINAPRSTAPGDMIMHRLFEQQVQRTPDRLALTGPIPHPQTPEETTDYTDYPNSTGKKETGAAHPTHPYQRTKSREPIAITYKQLNEKANQLADLLKEKGVQPGAIIPIMVEPSLEMITGILGILKAGSAYMPIAPGYPAKRPGNMLADSSARVLVTTGIFEKKTRQVTGKGIPAEPGDSASVGIHPVFLDRLPDPPLPGHSSPALPPTRSSDPVCVLYAPASTGTPRGLVIEHRQMAALMTGETGTREFNFGSIEAWNLLHTRCFSFSRQPRSYILDTHLNPVPSGVPGELCVDADSVARGYMNKPGLTGETFIENPYKKGSRLYRSGNLVKLSPQGEIEYLGSIGWQTRLKIQEKYWINEFAGSVPVPGLPIDYPAVGSASSEKSSLAFSLDTTCTTQIKKLANQEGADPENLLLAIFYVMLAKISGREDIVIGIPDTKSSHPLLPGNKDIGVNILAIRNYPQGNKPFAQFLEEVGEKIYNAFENREYPIERLQEKIAAKSRRSHHPLFQAIFAAREFKPGSARAKYDIMLTHEQKENTLSLRFFYPTPMYRKETIEKFAGYYREIAGAVTRDPAAPIAAIEMINKETREKLLKELKNKEKQTGKQTGEKPGKLEANFDI